MVKRYELVSDKKRKSKWQKTCKDVPNFIVITKMELKTIRYFSIFRLTNILKIQYMCYKVDKCMDEHMC